jgi:hypothetical protein
MAQRDRAKQMKRTPEEERSWNALAQAITSGGPLPTDTAVLRWLAEQEAARRGIPWPWPEGAPAGLPRRTPSNKGKR